MTREPDFPNVDIDVDVYGHSESVNLSEFADKLVIDPANIDVALVRQPNLYFNIATFAACAVATAERCRQQRDVWLAERIRDLRDAALSEGTKRAPGYDTLEAEAKSEKRFQELDELYIDAKQDASVLETARDAMKMRQFMLGHLAGAQKAEGI